VSLGSRGTGPSDVHDPRGLAVVVDALYVADAQNGRVQRRALDLAERTVAVSEGGEGGEGGEPPTDDAEGFLARPEAIAVADGTLYVSTR